MSDELEFPEIPEQAGLLDDDNLPAPRSDDNLPSPAAAPSPAVAGPTSPAVPAGPTAAPGALSRRRAQRDVLQQRGSRGMEGFGAAEEQVESGEQIETPEQLFGDEWFKMRSAVQQELVDQAGAGATLDSLKEEDTFFELATNTIRTKGWNVMPALEGKLIKFLRRDLFGYRGLEPILALKGVEDIIFNRFDTGFYVVGGTTYRIKERIFVDERDMKGFLDIIAADNNRSLNGAEPALDAVLRDGSRLSASIPPLAVDGTEFVIRKHRPEHFTIQEYIERGTLTAELAGDLQRWILAKANILVAGGTSTGKTTLLNTIGNAFLPPTDRMCIAEDTRELRIEKPNIKYWQTRQAAAGAREDPNALTIADVVKILLRKKPDRIIIGEVRGAEAYDALVGWNTGHAGGFMTIHADTAADALDRLVSCALEAGKRDEESLQKLIGRAVHFVVHVQRCDDGVRRIDEVVQVLPSFAFRRAYGAEQVDRWLAEGEIYDVWKNTYIRPIYELHGTDIVKVGEPYPIPGLKL